MGTPRVLARNLSFAWIAKFVYAASALFLTPVILRTLGEVEFGLWALVSGLTGYYGLLDMGIRPGLTRFITKYRVLADWEKLNQTASTGVAALSVCGLILWLITCGVSFLGPWLFSVSGSAATSLRWAIFLLGSSFSLQFPFFFQSAVFVATQRLDLGNMIGITSRLIQVTAIYLAVTNGYGLVGLAASVSIVELGTYLLRTFVATRLIPELDVSIRHVRKQRLKEFVTFSGWATLSHFCHELIATSGRYVVAFLLGASAVTRFQLAFGLVSQIRQLFSPIPLVFFPALANLAELQRKKELVSLYLSGTRLMTLLVVPAVIIACTLAPDFYQLWIGPGATGGDYPSAPFLMQILILGMLVRAPQAVGYQIFHATFRLKLLTKIMAGEALTNIAIATIFGKFLGLTGVALGGVIAGVTFEFFLIPIILSKQLEIPLAKLFVVTWVRPLLVGVALFPVVYFVSRISSFMSWTTLALESAIACCAALVLILSIGLTREERERFLWLPLGRRFAPANELKQ